ncbi:hypothetical protein ACONUD_19290 [Microbulbifer harenosus]|uniref:Uncharacterized protein n=1 Tax=Microbulbifer harenosus TaxID=2576840 RepID=A0ABY2UEQ6_9GAMM|nr:hypothetical protein [Microbulbifer harenosus]TLM72989.1 hypothetical protein FDY93_19275 [Microbulbifer harenosus]
MTFKQEIYRDINENCDVVLNLLKGQPVTNDTAEGRMIYQCRWLKQQVAADALTFPVNDYVHTLKHVSAERLLEHLASSPDLYREEIGVHLYRLLKLGPVHTKFCIIAGWNSQQNNSKSSKNCYLPSVAM